jgi:hypothetical protein
VRAGAPRGPRGKAAERMDYPAAKIPMMSNFSSIGVSRYEITRDGQWDAVTWYDARG